MNKETIFMDKNKWILNILLALFFVIFIISLYLFYNMPDGYEILTKKPATIFQISIVFFSILLLYRTKYLLLKLSKTIIEIFIVLNFMFLMLNFYEVMWGFNYWFSIQTTNIDIKNATVLDLVTYNPSNEITRQLLKETKPTNLNFTTKLNTAYLFISLYNLYFLNCIKNEKKSKNENKL